MSDFVIEPLEEDDIAPQGDPDRDCDGVGEDDE